jgi:acyl carrier protein
VNHSIPHLIHFGSSASWLGTVGQANHAYANFDLTAGSDNPGNLNEVSILWGAWTSRGAVKKYDAESWVNRIGMSTIQTQEGLNLMDRIIGSGTRELGVFQLDWSKYQEVMKHTPLIQDFMGVNDEFISSARIENSPEAFAGHDEVASWLEAELSYTLGYESRQSFDHDAGFFDLGLDSLTTLDLVKRIESKINAKLPSTVLFKYPTIQQLAGFVLDQYADFSYDAGSTGNQSEEDLAAMQFIDDQFNEMIDETR